MYRAYWNAGGWNIQDEYSETMDELIKKLVVYGVNLNNVQYQVYDNKGQWVRFDPS